MISRLLPCVTCIAGSVLCLGCESRTPTAPRVSDPLHVPRSVRAVTPTTTFTTIDFPDAVSTAADGINPAGDVVGRYTDAARKDHGFLLRRGEFTSIDFPGAVFFTAAAAINPRGDIVGNYRLSSDGSAVRHGFRLTDHTFTMIDFPGATFTNALGISPQGDVVGLYTNDGTAFHGYLLHDGAFTTVDVPGASSTRVLGINPAGDIVGSYQDVDGESHAFVRSHGAFATIDFPGALATGPYPLAPLAGVNAAGNVVGTYCDGAPCSPSSSGNIHGFVLSKGEFTALDVPGALSTLAFGINPSGDIVGVYVDASHRNHAFVMGK